MLHPSGIATAGVQGQLMLPELSGVPIDERPASNRFALAVTSPSVGLIDRLASFGRIVRGSALIALSPRRSMPQFIRHSSGGATNIPGNSANTISFLF